MLLARLFESLPLSCPQCGADRRILAILTEAAPVQRFLSQIDEPAAPPRIVPARGPPAWEDGLEPPAHWDAMAQSEYPFDQKLQW